MIALATTRSAGGNKVIFINEAIQDAAINSDFDVIITPFFFDNFQDGTMETIFTKLDASVVQKGIWLYCDFQNTGVWWQKVVLKLMYLFFT